MDWTDCTPVVSLLAGADPASCCPAKPRILPCCHRVLSQPDSHISAIGKGTGFIWTGKTLHSLAKNTLELLRSAVQHLSAVTPISDVHSLPESSSGDRPGTDGFGGALLGSERASQALHWKRTEGHEQPEGSSSSKAKAGVTAGEDVSLWEQHSKSPPCPLLQKHLPKTLGSGNQRFWVLRAL